MKRFYGFMLGTVLGMLVPLSWMLWRAYTTRSWWWAKWLNAEFERNGTLYILLAVAAVMILATWGYFWGRRFDELEIESLNVQNSNYELSYLAATDGLTGLFNGRAVNERLDIELDNAHKRPLSVLLIDIDHFKKINDQYGHPFGDQVLVGVASILKSCVRRFDAVGRLGGEEFVVILPETVPPRALDVADRIRAVVENEPFLSDQKEVHVTVSVGVADNHSVGLNFKEDLLKAADDALYKAKHAGRNRSVLWTPEMSLKSAQNSK